jgi:hypothetical protein
MIPLIKQLADAHRIGMQTGNWEPAIELSQQKEKMKKGLRKCSVCGKAISRRHTSRGAQPEHCAMHFRMFRFYGGKSIAAV